MIMLVAVVLAPVLVLPTAIAQTKKIELLEQVIASIEFLVLRLP
jgi:hypothetical protein